VALHDTTSGRRYTMWR